MKKATLLLMVVVSAMGCAQVDTFKKAVDSLFEDFDHLETPGYAVGISKKGKVIYEKGYGSANLDYNLPITAQSKFSIASVSKQFTAACIALLILDGKLSLETAASDFIPELKKYDDTIKIKHLVYNTSGIIDYHRLPRADGKSWITFNYFDVDECIQTSLKEGTLQFTPGQRWDYSNVNFMLLSKIVEKASKQPFSTFAEQRLFQPLGMNDTFIHDDITVIVKNRVTPYNIRNQEYIEGYATYGVNLKNQGDYIQHHRNSPHYGGSGVMTTVQDLLLWANNMKHPAIGGQKFYDIMHATPQFEHDRNNQAFGLHIDDFKGRKTVSWDGGDWGISSQLLRFPEQDIAIVVLSNLGAGEAYRKVNEIGTILIDHGIVE
ncbi:MAG: serine hydrolase domain-containing protein [Croceivirga sp.]|mgnify:CR=1 FL=1